MLKTNNKAQSVLAVIPARLQSQRYPKKVLADILGYPMIYHVYRQVAKCNDIDTLWVACDHQEIMKVCQQWNIPSTLSSTNHTCGTERVIEIQSRHIHDIVVNIQADEPLIQKQMIADMLKVFQQGFQGVVTLKTKLQNTKDYMNPNIVKVRCNENNHATCFKRTVTNNLSEYCKHIGIYAYDKQTLEKIHSLAPSEKEINLKLEQYRFIDHAIPIYVVETPYNTIGVDHPEDIKAVIKQLKISSL